MRGYFSLIEVQFEYSWSKAYLRGKARVANADLAHSNWAALLWGVVLWAVSVWAVALGSSNAIAQELAKPKTELGTLLRAVDVHPKTIFKSAEVDAARKRISQRISLSDPMLMLGVQNVPTSSFKLNEDMMTAKVVGLSQHFPFPGKLSKEGDLARTDVSMMEADQLDSKIALQRDVKIAYFEIYHLQRSVETDEAHLRSLAEIIRLAESRLATGKASQQEILALKIEVAQIRTDLENEQALKLMQLSELSMASGLIGDSIDVVDSLPLEPFFWSVAQLDSIALLHSPMIRAGQVGITSAQDGVDRASLAWYPDLDVTLMYMQRNTLGTDPPMKQSDMVSLIFGINLPIWRGRLDDAQGEQEALRTSASERLRATTLELHTRLTGLVAKLHGIAMQYLLLRTELIPLTDLSLTTSRTNYTYGTSSVEQVLRGELDLLHKVHDRYQYEAEYNKILAQIEYTVGQDLITR